MSWSDERHELPEATDPVLRLVADAAGPCLERLAEHGVLSLREPGGSGWIATITAHGTHCSIELENIREDELFAIVRALHDVAIMSWLDCPTGCLNKLPPGESLCKQCRIEIEHDRDRSDHERESGRNAAKESLRVG